MLSLLVPFVVYNLALKTYGVVSQLDEHGLAQTLDLISSDIFFNLGFALFWIGIFAAVRGREPLRWLVLVLFHATAIFITIVKTCAYQYFRETGTTLDYGTIAEWIPKFDEITPILFQGGIPLSAWVLLFIAFFYALLGPWLLMRSVEGWRGRSEGPPAGTAESSFLGLLGLWVLALALGSLSLFIDSGPAGASKSLARDQFVNVVLTGAEEASTEDDPDADSVVEHPAAYTNLAETPRTEKRNVVLIHLESTRAQSVTPYNEDLKTTPFLDELAESSLLAERAYVVVPSSSRATVAANGGVVPPLYKNGQAFYQAPEFESGGVPARCLAHLLKEQGYETGFFQSSSKNMDSFDAVANNLGYEEHHSPETMGTEGFDWVNYISYEDDIMLEPSEEWLKNNRDKPFMVEYLTGAGHDDYRCLSSRYGSEDFSEDDELNRYLNCLRLQDIFLNNLFEQYKELGLYENTVFVLFGDHGEAFGEHGVRKHGDVAYEEAIRVPLLIHAPGWFEGGRRVEGLSNQTDILPTVLALLGYELNNGEYPGYSLLGPLPEDRTLRFSCTNDSKCLASMKGSEKYIYYYDDQPDEFFDLSEDPLEKDNVAGERDKEELDKRREDLLAWLSRINAEYGR